MKEDASQSASQQLLRKLWFGAIQYPERHLIGRFSPVGNAAFVDPDYFEWASRLENRWRAIRNELDCVLKHKSSLPNFQEISDHITITDDDRWKTFFLYFYGHEIGANCARCPETTRLLEAIPGVTTAFFSILAPGKHIPEHRGPYKGVLRYHLGLKVPQPEKCCRIRVKDQVRHWEEGKSLVFDDTLPHEVWNDTSEERAVLFLDVVRPLPPFLSALNKGLLKVMKWSPPATSAANSLKRKARHRQHVLRNEHTYTDA